MNISGWNGYDEDRHCKGSFVQWPLDNTRHVDETKMTDGNGDQSDGKTQTTKKGKRRNKQDKEENEIGESDGERTKKGKRKKKQDKENDPMIAHDKIFFTESDSDGEDSESQYAGGGNLTLDNLSLSQTFLLWLGNECIGEGLYIVTNVYNEFPDSILVTIMR